ncbi:glucosaminidase domain-containing protein [Flavobacterium sp. N2820]|jgi:flagellum-specific peptidoglycan hydrolase FlgJ|uniref:glucosaminidase domain-containing protein n=1 Tax=Flavobacterium sp. N2820 TaxID=2986834 RepID=UPI0022251B6F|nr:glucosaminidase domain-containing protein [Flavobacterium sp. N2820]
MIKKIALLLIVVLVASCNSTRPVVRTTSKSKPKTTTTKKPVAQNASTKSTTPKASGENKGNEVQLEATSNIRTYDDEIKLYISNFQEIAKNNMKSHGIPASITLAQGILESGAGKGKLAQAANNHFGIKCHTGWTGESVKHDDDAAQECFRKYNHPSESYRDHSLFLTSRSRYANLFKLDKGDYEAWAKGLKDAGYATDRKYPDKLIGLIERFELYKYDNEVLSREYVPVKKDSLVENSEGLYTIQQGDTLYSLSKKFNLSVEDLKKLNDLSDNAINIGQKIKIK